MKTAAIRLVHWDAGVRRRWRTALEHLQTELLECAGSSEIDPGDREILVVGNPGGGTRAALAFVRKHSNPNRHFIMVAGNGESSEEFAIDALNLGVKAYLREPVSTECLASAVSRWIEPLPAASDRANLGLIGKSESIRRVRDQIRQAALVDSTVLVTGESGTGKELAARMLHELSRRRGRLVTLNCAAIPDSLLESELFGYERGAFTGAYRSETGKLTQADSGTLFLDEIANSIPSGNGRQAMEGRRYVPVAESCVSEPH